MAGWAQQQPPGAKPVRPLRRDRAAGLWGRRAVWCALCSASKLFSVWWQCCTAAHLRTSTAPADFLARASCLSADDDIPETPAGVDRWQCGQAGCHRRFGRYNLRDMKHAMQRHFCCVCQRVFCHHHTSYSPHGPFGSCGMESQCICDGCYATLPRATQVSAVLTALAVHHGGWCSLYHRHAIAKDL